MAQGRTLRESGPGKGGIAMFFKKAKASGLTAEIRVRRCYGCGAILQSNDPNEAGYIPKEKFDNSDQNLCERCYKLRHYSSFQESGDLSLDYVTILEHAKQEGALIVYVVNAFALTGSFLEGIGKHLPENVLVVINKRDLLPENYSDNYLIALVKENLKKEEILAKDILICSANRKDNIDALIADIDKNRRGKSVYFIGAYQVGKSSLINTLLMNYTNSTDRMITTSPYPGTTLDVISIPLDEKTCIYDTPGIYNSKSMISFLEPKIVKYVQPRSLVKPELYNAKEGQSFLLSNLARLDFLAGERTDFTFYKSNDLTIQRAKTSKADSLLASLSKEESETKTEKVKGIEDLIPHAFTGKKDEEERIIINGLGFIDFRGSGQSIKVFAPKGVEVYLMPRTLRK